MDGLSAFLQRHDVTIDLITIWLVVVAAAFTAIDLFRAAWELRGTEDQTDLGRDLKRQKVALGLVSFVNGFYWAFVLFAYYTDYVPGMWEKSAIRLVFAGGMVLGSVFVRLFIRSLRKERCRGTTGSIPLGTDRKEQM